MEWADEVHRGVPGQQSRTAAIFRLFFKLNSSSAVGRFPNFYRRHLQDTFQTKLDPIFTSPSGPTLPETYFLNYRHLLQIISQQNFTPP
jgi:hypothetical protein